MSDDDNKLIAERRAKLAAIREQGLAFPNDFRRNVVAGELHARYGDMPGEELEASPVRVSVAGRMMSKRIMGKASFANLKDMSGSIQLFVQRDSLPEKFLQRTIQEVGCRRYPRCRRCAVSYQDRRVVDQGGVASTADQVAASAA